MLTKKSISAPILATCISLSSGDLFAAEETLSSMVPIWPFLVIVALIFFFRKQLNCAPPFKSPEDTATKSPEDTATAIVQEPATVEADEPQTKPEPEQEPVAPTSTVIPEATTTADINDNIIDLKDNSQQCQASTAKGTRCKRKTTLEDAAVTIDDKTYLLTVCRQHNTEQLQPFSELIK